MGYLEMIALLRRTSKEFSIKLHINLYCLTAIQLIINCDYVKMNVGFNPNQEFHNYFMYFSELNLNVI